MGRKFNARQCKKRYFESCETERRSSQKCGKWLHPQFRRCTWDLHLDLNNVITQIITSISLVDLRVYMARPSERTKVSIPPV